MKKLKGKVCNGTTKKAEWKWLTILKKQATEFCRETGLHGYKYIVQPQRSKAERIVWGVAVFTSLCCALVLMKFTWDYYATHPVLTVIESTHHGIWNYPFPAVTVCDINRVSLNLSRALAETLKLPSNMSKEYVVQEMGLLNELLYPGRNEYNITSNLSRLQDIFDYNGLTIPTVIRLVTRDCESLLEACKWKVQPRNCTEIFQHSLTRDGLCCSFNYIPFDKIQKSPSVQPKRITACGHQTGISILLDFHPEDYHATIIGSVGAKILLHEPYDYPDHNAPSKLIGVNKYMFLTVKPDETYSTENVRDLTISTRNCIFSDESHEIKGNRLEETFKPAKYSFINCLTKCRSAVIKDKCGCIPYYYPQNGSRICNLRDTICLHKYKDWYETSWPGTNMAGNAIYQSFPSIKMRPCGCVPDCNFYRYTTEDSQSNLNRQLYYNGLKYTKWPGKGKAWRNHSIVHIYFGDLVSTQYRRNVHYNWRNLFASFGGLLGLFAGFSLVSVFEFIYFFVIRVITDSCRRKKKEKTRF